MKKLLLLFVLFSLAASTFAIAVEIDGIWYEMISTNKVKEAKVCWATDENNIVIPETVEYEGITYRVTSIKEGAFARKNLVSITIPKSVKSIGLGAFTECWSLESVHITDIEAWCKIPFDYYYYDHEEYVEKYVSNPLYYASHLFVNGEEIKDLVIPISVTSIGKYTFQRFMFSSVTVCITDFSAYFNNKLLEQIRSYIGAPIRLADKEGNEIKEFIIPDDMSTIDNRAFSGCSGLTSITIPASVMTIGEGAFSGCSGLASIIIPNNVTSIGSGAFFGCSGLTNINIGNSITSIGIGAFSGCSGLTSIELHCKEIGSWFSGLSSIKDVVLGNGVTSIGNDAFDRCSGLTSIEIPNSVTSIGQCAFSGCRGLTSVHISDLEAWCKISFSSNPFSSAHHLFLNGAEITNLVIPNSVRYIGEYAFSGCSGLTSVTIGNSVTSIGKGAFSGCSGLTSITIPNSVTSIGEMAFYGCTGLTSITIPSSVTSIGEMAFSGCTGLTSITIPSSVTSIDGAFSGCTGLTSITIPSSVTSIDGAFSGCTGLTSITIPSSVTSMDGAFSGCSSLISVTIGRGVKNIGSGAFSDCIELTDVYCYAEAVPSTDSNVFDGSYIDYSTLHVPAASIDAYKSTTPWSSFKTIIGITGTEPMTYKLIYMVDGVEYRTYEINEGASITSEPAPMKEGYSFSGWSEIPETMPAHDVTITGVFTKNPPMEKCATPTIAFKDGKLVFDCETEGVEFVYSFSSTSAFASTSTSAYQLVGNNVNLPTKYKVTVYAKKDGYENSETVTKEIDVRGLMGDMNEDGSLSVTDVTILIDKILKQK
jgi:hypothetical protein